MVNVMLCGYVDGFSDDPSVVVVVAMSTTCESAPDVLPALPLSPL